jgi:putative transposase
MPRRARLRLAGVPLHVIQRGNNRAPCFFAVDDYVFYLNHLAEFARKFDCLVHAYVLMTNHVHLLLTPEAVDSASLLMKHLGQRYVQYVNRTYRRSGTLWEGRFKSCLAQSDTYVLTCYRYIESNPVRAAMTAQPGDYRWSSYRANAEGEPCAWLVAHDEYRRLGKSAPERQANYRALFDAPMAQSQVTAIRDATNGNVALGSRSFQIEIETALGRRASRGKPGRPRGSAIVAHSGRSASSEQGGERGAAGDS